MRRKARLLRSHNLLTYHTSTAGPNIVSYSRSGKIQLDTLWLTPQQLMWVILNNNHNCDIIITALTTIEGIPSKYR